jgi:dephospho-CoA kinase
MSVICQRLNNLLVGHDNEGRAVHQAPLFVCPRQIQVERAMQQRGCDEHDTAARILQDPFSDLGKAVARARSGQSVASFGDDSISQHD